MDYPSNVQPVSDAKSPQRKPAGDFVVHAERSEESLLLSVPQELTPSQQRKSDALELAELIYKIYNDTCPAIQNGSTKKESEDV